MMKLLFTFGVLIGILISLAVVGTLFMYAGWNFGLVCAMPSVFNTIDFITAWWLSVFFATIGGFFKPAVNTKKD